MKKNVEYSSLIFAYGKFMMSFPLVYSWHLTILRSCYCKKQIDVSYLSVCLLIDDKFYHKSESECHKLLMFKILGLGLSWPSEDANETAPGLFVTFGAVTPCMEHFLTVLKRKTRGSSSGAPTPKEKRICEPSFEAEDKITIALDMAEDIGSQLQLVLQKLNSLESLVEGVLQRFNNLESSVNGIKGEVATLSAKSYDFEKAIGTMDRSLLFLNSKIEQLKSRMDEDEAEIKSLNNCILYQDIYS